MYRIYRVVNLATGKVYIGKTVKTARKRWTEHLSAAKVGIKTYLYDSIRKHGRDAFEVREIDIASTAERASEFERFYIRLFDACDPTRGYNLTMGGEGTSLTPEQSKRKGERLRELGIAPSAFCRELAVLANRKHTGWHHSEDTRRRCRLAQPLLRTDILDQDIVRLYEQGLSCAAIANRFAVSRTVIWRRLRTLKIQMRPVGRQKQHSNTR